MSIYTNIENSLVRHSNFGEYLFYGFMTLILALFLIIGICPVYILGCSMSPTIAPGSLCIAKDIHSDDPLPERGSIVIFSSDIDSGILYAKRLIGLPGDSLSAVNDVLSINGTYYDCIPGTGGWIADVPDGCVFVLGDNRNNSFDSCNFGCVSIEQITAKILFSLPFS